MRVISGTAKGLRLKAPRSARPTTELVKGAVFAILAPLVREGARVLDLYAGSGALGIEALSRGAAWADLVEQEPRSCAVIKENLNKVGLAAESRVWCASASRAIRLLEGEYDVVFMDPPYAHPSLDALTAEVAASPRLPPGSLLVVLHSSRFPLQAAYADLALIKERRHGDTQISIYRKGGAS